MAVEPKQSSSEPPCRKGKSRQSGCREVEMTRFPHLFLLHKFAHALAESSAKIVGEAAWRSCRELQIVTCQTQSSAHCVAPLAGAKFYEGRLPPVASISVKCSRSVDPQRGWAWLNAPTNVSNTISLNGSEFCRPMPMIGGEKTF